MALCYYTEIDSPIGTLLLRGDGKSLTHLHMVGQRYRPQLPQRCVREDAKFLAAREQLDAMPVILGPITSEPANTLAIPQLAKPSHTVKQLRALPRSTG